MSLDALVLLPGLDGTGTLFADLVSELPQTLKINVARYPTQTFLSYSELIPWVEKAIPSNRSFLLVAESFSTPLAVKFAATRAGGAAFEAVLKFRVADCSWVSKSRGF